MRPWEQRAQHQKLRRKLPYMPRQRKSKTQSDFFQSPFPTTLAGAALAPAAPQPSMQTGSSATYAQDVSTRQTRWHLRQQGETAVGCKEPAAPSSCKTIAHLHRLDLRQQRSAPRFTELRAKGPPQTPRCPTLLGPHPGRVGPVIVAQAAAELDVATGAHTHALISSSVVINSHAQHNSHHSSCCLAVALINCLAYCRYRGRRATCSVASPYIAHNPSRALACSHAALKETHTADLQ
jgi:hypothetical protein